MDSWGGKKETPISLHKYLYANGSPTIFVDPSGHQASIPWWWFFFVGSRVHDIIGRDFTSRGANRVANYVTIAEILGIANDCIGCDWKPDLVDRNTNQIYEIKSVNQFLEGYEQLGAYLGVFHLNDPLHRLWLPGTEANYQPISNFQVVTFFGTYDVEVFQPFLGVILYQAIHRQLVTTALAAVVIYGVAQLAGLALKSGTYSLGATVGTRTALAFAGG